MSFKRVKEIKTSYTIPADKHDEHNILWIIFDSCRYDSLLQANTPVLDSFGPIYRAWTHATYTLPSHMSFFAGILPLVYEPIPYLNRFTKQLITMRKAGQAKDSAKGKYTIELPSSKYNVVHGLNKKGYYTVGTAGATWFAKNTLKEGFQKFQYKREQSVQEQANFILKHLSRKSPEKPFFAFMNLMETHNPYMHFGSDREEYSMHIRNSIQFPPEEDTTLRNTKGKKLHQAQITAAEHLDNALGKIFPQLPPNTFVIVTADHGECFGEDGFWGHGIYHEKVMEVPMLCFMLNRQSVNE